MTVKLSDLQRRLPVVERAAYERAYEEAALAGRIGELVHRLRAGAGLSAAELALAMGVDEEEISQVEEGDPAVTLAFVDRLGRALGTGMTLRAGRRPAAGGPSEVAGSVSFGAPVPTGEPRDHDLGHGASGAGE